MNFEYIFVYGTLRKETATSMAHFMARHCEFFSDGHINGKLYGINGYPGAVESSDEVDKIHGEVYKISKPEIILPRLDEYEECSKGIPAPHEFTRKKLHVTLSDGENLLAWVYIYNHETKDLEKIDSGDFLLYLSNKSLN